MGIIKDKEIIFREEFGQSVIIGIFGKLSLEEKEALKARNVDISPIPLQKLFIYLTESDSVKGVI